MEPNVHKRLEAELTVIVFTDNVLEPYVYPFCLRSITSVLMKACTPSLIRHSKPK